VNVALLTDSLCEFYTAEAIREIWKQILDASMGRARLPLQVNARARDGSSASSILVSTMTEAEAYMAACKAAVARLEETTTTSPADLGTTVDFRYRPVLV